MFPPTYQLGPLRLDTSGSVFGIAFLTLVLISAPRLRRAGISGRHLGLLAPLLLVPAGLGAVYAHAMDQGGLAIFRYWVYAPLVHPGASYLGGLLGGLLGCVAYCRMRGIRASAMLDALAPGLMALYSIGRVGCHLAGHATCRGPETQAWFGVLYPYSVGPAIRVVPTAILESILAGLAMLVLLRTPKPAKPGALFAMYLLLQGAERFVIEFLRVNPSHLLGLSQAQWLSAGLMGFSLVMARPCLLHGSRAHPAG